VRAQAAALQAEKEEVIRSSTITTTDESLSVC
jgi:hypothetical protein